MTCLNSTRSVPLAFLLGSAVLAAACAKRPAERLPDAVLVTIDTLRADRWGCTGDPAARTPVADRLARGGALAFEARAPAPITLPSHATMMTGLAPASHGLRDNGLYGLAPDGPRTLAEAFQSAGYATAAFVSAYPLASRFGLDRGFDRYDDYLGDIPEETPGSLRERAGDELVGRVRRYFERGRAPGADTPLFLWAHFFDPHAPYAAPVPWDAALANDAYRAEIAFADRQVGRLLAELSARRPDARRVVVATSDHGEGLGEHGEMTHGVLLHAATIRVAVVATATDRYVPTLLASPVSLESVPRTLLGLAGVPDSLAEHAAPPLDAPPTAVLSETMYPWFNFGWRALRSWESQGWKLVSGETDRLYAFADDPAELRDVASARPEIARRLKSELLSQWSRLRERAAGVSRGALSEEDALALRSLGYAASSASASDADSEEAAFTTGPDPEPRAPLVDRVNRAITLRGQGEFAGARAILLDVVASDPRNRLAWEELGGVELDRGDPASARDAFERALSLGRNPPWVPLRLAEALRRLGDPTLERAALLRAVEADPLSLPARQGLFRLALADGDSAAALRYLEESASIRPRSVATQMALAEFFEARGDRNQAIIHWKRAAELDSDGELGDQARARLASRKQETP